MKNYNLEDLYSLVEENDSITFRSIFDFTGGMPDVFAFIGYCQARNCTVLFENEALEVLPGSDTITNIKLTAYAFVAEHPGVVIEYLKYMTDLTQPGVLRAPTLISESKVDES